jgi:Chaperone of endosialidase
MPSLNTGNAILSNPIKVETTAYNVGIGAAASSSFKLQVTGTTNLTGALTGTSATFSGTSGAFIGVTINNTDATGSARLRVTSTGSNINDFSSFSASHPTRANQAWIGGDGNSTTTVLQAGGVEFLRGTSTGAATFSSSVTANNIFKASQSSVGGYFQSFDGANEQIFGSWKSIVGSGNSYDSLIYSSNASSGFYVMTGGSTTPKLSIASTGAATFVGGASAAPATSGTTTNSMVVFKPNDGSNAIIMGAYPSVPNANWIQSQATTALGTTFPLVLQPIGGNVGIGTSSPNSLFVVNGGDADFRRESANSRILVTAAGVANTVLGFNNSGSTVTGVSNNTGYVGVLQGYPLAFITDSVERMRITSAGFTKISNNGTYINSTATFHEISTTLTNNNAVYITNTASSNPYGPYISFPNASPNDTTRYFFACGDSTTDRFIARSNGGLANFQANDVNLSDERTKKDIIPLESYWDKFKAIEIVKFKYKDQTHDDFNIGVIAQQVEKIAPEFVDVDGWDKPKLDEDGNEIVSNEIPLKSIYTSDLHHATIKVLQEAMARIEEQQAQIEAQQQQINSLINR